MSQTNSLQLLIKVIKVLSHKVRNPLSVISNDLNYLQLLDPKQDCQRSISRCREISEYFKPVEILDSQNSEQFELISLISEVFNYQIVNKQEIIVSANYNNLKQALVWLKSIFPEFDVEQTDPKALRFSLKDKINSRNDVMADLYAGFDKEHSILPLLIDAILEDSKLKFEQKEDFFELRKL